MGSPERSRGYARRDVGDSSDVKGERVGDEEDWDSSDRRKHRSSKSRRSSKEEDSEVSEMSGRRRSSTDQNESRKRSGEVSKPGSDDDDYDTRKELRTRQMKKKLEESSLEKLSSWYQDGELENKHENRDKSLSRSHGRADESEKKKMTLRMLDHENSQSRSKIKEERSYEGEAEKRIERDSRYSERREISWEKGHGSTELSKSHKGKRDDFVSSNKDGEGGHVEAPDLRHSATDIKHDGSKDTGVSDRVDIVDYKSRISESDLDKGSKFNDRDEAKVDANRSKSRGRSEAPEEDNKVAPFTRELEDRSAKEKNEKLRQQRNPVRDGAESRERSSNVDDDGSTWQRERSGREVEYSSRSRTPENSGRRHQESESSELDFDRSSMLKRREYEKDGYRDDRVKERDDSWSDKNRDREGSREIWKRRQPSSAEKDTKSRDNVYDHARDWELQRPARERADGERPQGRSGGRKDGRTEAVKTSSNYGISNENYDVIEIQTKALDFREESSYQRRSETSQYSDVKSASNEEDWNYSRDEKEKRFDTYSSGPIGDASTERYMDDDDSMRDQNLWRDARGQPGRGSGFPTNQGINCGSQLPYGNQDHGPLSRGTPQGSKGTRVGRGGRVRPGVRDGQQVPMPLPMIGSPFVPLGMPPPGPIQPLNPAMSPAPGPPIGPGVFLPPPFSPPLVWAGARGVDMNVLAVPTGLSPVPPGPVGPRFPANIGNPPNPGMFFGQAGPGRGLPLPVSGPALNAMVPAGRAQPHDKGPGGWVPSRTSGPGKAPSRGEQNDYSQNFVDTGMRPQNFIRELELTNVVEDYPKLRELIQKKDEIVTNSSTPPMYYKCDLREHVLNPDFFGTKFDVILVDPPWEEYVHRAPGLAEHTDHWTFEEIQNLKIEAIADTPSFIFLWVGDGVGLEQGRQCLKKWGFRRCEDICWVKTNKTTATPGLRHDSHTLFQHSKEHCLLGIKGTVRRSTDGHIIHANIDTDVIIAEEPPYGSTAKPEDMYRIIEHFSLGRRRLELFGEDHNIRAGWLTVGKGLTSSNFNAEAYIKNFADKDGKVWQGGGGRNPPPESPHLVLTTPDIEALRPKSPMKNQHQMQQSASISLTTGNSTNKRPTGNSPQNPTSLTLNQEACSNPSTPSPWGASMEGFKGREGGNFPPDDRIFDMQVYNPAYNNDYMDFDPHRGMNMF